MNLGEMIDDGIFRSAGSFLFEMRFCNHQLFDLFI